MRKGTLFLILRITAGLFAALFGVLLVVGFFAPPITISRDQAQLQAIADKHLPKSFDRYGSTFTVERVAISLDNALMLDGKGNGELRLGKRRLGSLSAAFSAAGKVAYRNDRSHGKAFFFEPTEPVRPRDFAFEGETLGSQVKGWSKRLKSNVLRDVVGLGADTLDDKLPDIVGYSVGQWLAHFPVYRLKDDAKGYIISMALEKVEVKEGKLFITFSLRQVTWTLVGWLVAFLVACGLLAVLVLNPEIIVPLALLGAMGS